MRLFDPRNSTQSPRHSDVYVRYQIAHTSVDFAAAVLFLAGSVMFLDRSLLTPATWCFIVGSAFFLMKPTLRLVRELHFRAIGDAAGTANG